MAEESDQERTEAPSQQRLDKAREEGQVPQSRELATFVVLMTGGAALWMMANQMGRSLSDIVRGGLAFEPAVGRDSHYAFDKLSGQVFDAALALAPFLLLVILATLAGPLLLRGWLFSVNVAGKPLAEMLTLLSNLGIPLAGECKAGEVREDIRRAIDRLYGAAQREALGDERQDGDGEQERREGQHPGQGGLEVSPAAVPLGRQAQGKGGCVHCAAGRTGPGRGILAGRGRRGARSASEAASRPGFVDGSLRH